MGTFCDFSLLELKGFVKSPKNISTRLNISIGVTKQALTRLESLGLVKEQKSQYILLKKNLQTSTDISSACLRQGHQEYIEKSLRALEEVHISQRDITGITMAIDSKKLPEAKKLIQNFRKRLAEFLEKDNQDQVYRLNIQLFPLSKLEDK